jgi:hypothetical protein
MSVTRRKRALYAEPAEGVFVPEFTVLGVSRRTAGRCKHDAEAGLSDVKSNGQFEAVTLGTVFPEAKTVAQTLTPHRLRSHF